MNDGKLNCLDYKIVQSSKEIQGWWIESARPNFWGGQIGIKKLYWGLKFNVEKQIEDYNFPPTSHLINIYIYVEY